MFYNTIWNKKFQGCLTLFNKINLGFKEKVIFKGITMVGIFEFI
jgi:hypothetical protein